MVQPHCINGLSMHWICKYAILPSQNYRRPQITQHFYCSIVSWQSHQLWVLCLDAGHLFYSGQLLHQPTPPSYENKNKIQLSFAVCVPVVLWVGKIWQISYIHLIFFPVIWHQVLLVVIVIISFNVVGHWPFHCLQKNCLDYCNCRICCWDSTPEESCRQTEHFVLLYVPFSN